MSLNSNPTVQDIYNAFVSRAFLAPSFVKKSETYDTFQNEGGQRPAMYVRILSNQAQNSIDGLPNLYNLTLEVHIRADRSAYPNKTGPQVLMPLEREVVGQFKASPIDGFNTLGFPRGWVMHAFMSSTEYFYDLIGEDNIAEAIITFQVLAAPEVVSN